MDPIIDVEYKGDDEREPPVLKATLAPEIVENDILEGRVRRLLAAVLPIKTFDDELSEPGLLVIKLGDRLPDGFCRTAEDLNLHIHLFIIGITDAAASPDPVIATGYGDNAGEMLIHVDYTATETDRAALENLLPAKLVELGIRMTVVSFTRPEPLYQRQTLSVVVPDRESIKESEFETAVRAVLSFDLSSSQT